MKVTTIQPALPFYRHDFFQRVHEALGDAFCVAYSPTALSGITTPTNAYPWARQIGPLRPLGPGMEWQDGALALPIARGDVVVVCGAPRTLSTLALIARAKANGARVIWWGHYWSSTSKTWRFALRMAMLRACDGVLFYTDAEVAEYRARRGGGANTGPLVRALNNGINTDPIATVRAPFDPAGRGRALLFIGRLTPKAGLALALEALALIPASQRPRLEVIGSGEEDAALREQARALGLEEHVAWHGSITDEAGIAAIANRCRAFVYPGEVGLSLIHAMAYGLPAIVHDNRWRHMPEIAAFADGATGRAFAHISRDSLASTITGLIDDPETLSAYSANALKRVTDTYNTKDMARRFVDMVEEVRNLPRSREHRIGAGKA